MSWTLKEARPYIARIPNVNLCADDERVVDLINRGIEDMVVRSRGALLHQRIAVCAACGAEPCIVWPRQVASITDLGGEIRDGERIPIIDGQLSTNQFQNGLQRVHKDTTKGRVQVYAVDPITSAETLIAIYEPDEPNPTYRKTLVRGCSRTGTNT